MADNICAIATPYGTGAISIIRCSGPDAIVLVNNIFKGKNLVKCKSHTMHYGYIIENNEIIDEVLCNIFKSPNSFDGENCVEINCHGGIYVTNMVLRACLKVGFRMAEPGEFSKRAFLNGRLDLTQAESIMDIISASNSIALKSSTNSLRKATFNLVKGFRDRLLDIIAKIEVNIDYPEYDDAEFITNEYLLPVVDEMLIDMKKILDSSKISNIAIHGIKTAIIGKPNVGKSSLLNMLLDEDKAIVSDIAGTTRDMIEASLSLGNATLHLIDTAGIRQSNDYVESIGIERSQKAIENADLILLVLDSSNDLADEDIKLLELTKNKKRIIIANKSDLIAKWNNTEAIYISARNKDGLEKLFNKILEITSLDTFDYNGQYLNNNRQIDLMNKAYDALCNAKAAIDMQMDVDLIEIDIKNAFDYLGEITGEANPEELITALFTKFCLGK